MTMVRFPSVDHLRAALIAGHVPVHIAQTAVRWATDSLGAVIVESEMTLPRAAVIALNRSKAAIVKQSEVPLHQVAPCWSGILSLQSDREFLTNEILIELPDVSMMPSLSTNLRRLGSRLVSWRTFPNLRRVLARIQHPSFSAFASPMPQGWTAFIEQSTGIWVESGFRHPIDVPSVAPDDSLILIRRTNEWETIPDPKHRKPRPTFPILGTSKPAVKNRQPSPITVSPRLIHEPRPIVPSLWILQGDRPNSFRQWLAHIDDGLVRQFQAVQIDCKNGKLTVLMARNNREQPSPILSGVTAYCNYLNLPNLFVPRGLRLSLALRRDFVRRHFAPDSQCIYLLDPGAGHDLVQYSFSRNAFVPLLDWLRYQPGPLRELIPVDSGPLFALDSFETRERPAPKQRPKPPPSAPIKAPQKQGLVGSLIAFVKGAWRVTHDANELALSPSDGQPALEDDVGSTRDTPSPVSQGIESVRSRLLNTANAAIEADWTEIARISFAEKRFDDAALCWQQVLWQSDANREIAAAGWVRSECTAAGQTDNERSIHHWVHGPIQSRAVRCLAAHVVRSVEVTGLLPPTLDPMVVARRLTEGEAFVSIRAAWLAQSAIARITGDQLQLARTRDRLFARLLESGLRLDADVPTFLRSEEFDGTDRVSAVRDWLIRSKDFVARWLGARPSGRDPDLVARQRYGLARERNNTLNYAHMMISWGMAAIGARQSAIELLRATCERVPVADPIHLWLRDAFTQRVTQSAAHIHQPLLADSLRLRREQLTFEGQYAVDRLRNASRILEPSEMVNAFQAMQNPEMLSIVELNNVGDPTQLAHQIETLLRRSRPTAQSRLRILTPALEVALRGGEPLVVRLLEYLLLELDPFTGHVTQLEGLRCGLRSCGAIQNAHFAERLIDIWLRWLRRGPAQPNGFARILSAAIPVLRRLELQNQLATLTNAIESLIKLQQNQLKASPSAELRLAIASGRLVLDQHEPAMTVVDEVRATLFAFQRPDEFEQLNTVISYIDCLRYASARLALGRLEEVFQRFPVPNDAFMTNVYYSLSSLRVVDAAVRAAANDDFTLGPRIRRWLDTDEFCIRRRIQADLDRTLANSGLQS